MTDRRPTNRVRDMIDARQQKHRTITCPGCAARLKVRANARASTVACPKCGSEVPLAAPPPAGPSLPPRQKRGRKKQAVGFRLKIPADQMPAVQSAFDAHSAITPEELPPPPRWTFFSGIFTYPWYLETAFRWLMLSIGFSMIGLIGIFIVAVLMTAAGFIGMILAFFSLPLIWISIWTFSYAAACLLVVLEDTAAGNDRVHSWPEPNWREWTGSLFCVAYIASWAVAAGFGVGRLAEISEQPFWPYAAGAAFLVFPVLLLSALEAEAFWIPFSPPILKSLFSLWWGWILFYVLAGIVVAAYAASVVAPFLHINPFVAMGVSGPVLAAAVIIYARLLGRLAWRASQISESEDEDDEEE